MFEILFAVPHAVAVDAAYQISLELSRRARLGNWRDDARMAAAARSPAPAPESAEGPEVAGYLLGAIERRERKPLRELSEAVAGGYIVRLGAILRERVRTRPGYDPERADRLLEELRRDYGGYPREAAA